MWHDYDNLDTNHKTIQDNLLGKSIAFCNNLFEFPISQHYLLTSFNCKNSALKKVDPIIFLRPTFIYLRIYKKVVTCKMLHRDNSGK